MNTNPYESPPAVPAGYVLPALPPSRPLGIAVLAALHLVGGAAMGALGLFLLWRFDAQERESAFNWLVIIIAPLLALASMATGWGLWRGKKWAWWLATLYYFQFAAGSVILLVLIPVSILAWDRPVNQRVFEVAARHGVRLLIWAPLTWSMFSRKIYAYFGFRKLTRLRALGILVGIFVLLALIMVLAIGVAVAMGIRPG